MTRYLLEGHVLTIVDECSGVMDDGTRIFTAYRDDNTVMYLEASVVASLQKVPGPTTTQEWRYSGFDFTIVLHDGLSLADYALSAKLIADDSRPGQRLSAQRFFRRIDCTLPSCISGRQVADIMHSFYIQFRLG